MRIDAGRFHTTLLNNQKIVVQTLSIVSFVWTFVLFGNLEAFLYQRVFPWLPPYYWTAAGLALALPLWLVADKHISWPKWIVPWLVLFVGVATVWYFSSQSGEFKQLALNLRLNAAGMIVMFLLLYSTPQGFRWGCLGIIAAVLFTILQIYQEFLFPGLINPNHLCRSTGLLLNPNNAGTVLVIGILACSQVMPIVWRERFIVASSLAVLMTFSRSAVVGLALIMGWLIYKRAFPFRFLHLAGYTVAGVLLFAACYGTILNESQQRMFVVCIDYQIARRLLGTTSSMQVAMEAEETRIRRASSRHGASTGVAGEGGSESFAEKFEDFEDAERYLSDEGEVKGGGERIVLIRDSIARISQAPLLGAGLGSTMALDIRPHNIYLDDMEQFGIWAGALYILLVAKLFSGQPTQLKAWSAALGFFLLWEGLFSHNVYELREVLIAVAWMSMALSRGDDARPLAGFLAAKSAPDPNPADTPGQ